jgi:hypothetical protein
VAAFETVAYLVDALRSLMVVGGQSAFGLGFDLVVQLGALFVLVLVAARLCPAVAA